MKKQIKLLCAFIIAFLPGYISNTVEASGTNDVENYKRELAASFQGVGGGNAEKHYHVTFNKQKGLLIIRFKLSQRQERLGNSLYYHKALLALKSTKLSSDVNQAVIKDDTGKGKEKYVNVKSLHANKEDLRSTEAKLTNSIFSK